jgi:hypothetical protein
MFCTRYYSRARQIYRREVLEFSNTMVIMNAVSKPAIAQRKTRNKTL